MGHPIEKPGPPPQNNRDRLRIQYLEETRPGQPSPQSAVPALDWSGSCQSATRLGPDVLERQADAAQEVGEARVASERVESGIHPDESDSIRSGEIGFLKPAERFLVIAQGGVHASDVEPADVPLPPLCLDR